MKKIYGITSVDVQTLENNEFFQLMSESRSEVAAFIKENKVDGIYTTKLDEMDKLLEQLQAGFIRPSPASWWLVWIRLTASAMMPWAHSSL